MKISVIIPCYNCELYITRCLDSLERQTVQPFDVILVNDCSTDKTEETISQYIKYSNLNIKYITNTKNLGPSKSRERGIVLSASDFICFCDSDDWYDVDFIEEMIRKQAENNADIVFCAHKLAFKSNKYSMRNLSLKVEDLKCKSSIIVKSPDSLCMMMTRTSLFDKIKMPDLRNGEDMALVPVLVARANNFNATKKHLYNYYCRPDSASQTANMHQIQSLVKSFEYIENNLSDEFYTEREYLGIRNLLYGALINLFKFSSDHSKADEILDWFENSYPSWMDNQYITLLSLPKRLFLNLIYKRSFRFARCLSIAHRFLMS